MIRFRINPGNVEYTFYNYAKKGISGECISIALIFIFSLAKIQSFTN